MNAGLRIKTLPIKNEVRSTVGCWLTCCAVCAALIWTSCQTRNPLVTEPVGPPPLGPSLGKLDRAGIGYLTVYSATEMKHGGKDLKYYPHSGYSIYGKDGKLFQWVDNSTGSNDEIPSVVPLPAGNYRVRAKDDDYGRISVPVIIQGGQITTVHLESRATPRAGRMEASDSVGLPDGRVVGWRAREPMDSTRR